jgi:hypothetical protein
MSKVLVEPGFLIIFTISDDKYNKPIVDSVVKTKARGTYTVVASKISLKTF